MILLWSVFCLLFAAGKVYGQQHLSKRGEVMPDLLPRHHGNLLERRGREHLAAGSFKGSEYYSRLYTEEQSPRPVRHAEQPTTRPSSSRGYTKDASFSKASTTPPSVENTKGPSSQRGMFASPESSPKKPPLFKLQLKDWLGGFRSPKKSESPSTEGRHTAEALGQRFRLTRKETTALRKIADANLRERTAKLFFEMPTRQRS